MSNPIHTSLLAIAAGICLTWSPHALAQNSEPVVPLVSKAEPGVEPLPELWNFHGQATIVSQWHSQFSSAYSGANSLHSAGENRVTADATFMLGRRLWKGAEFWINPEIDQGFGLSDTVGVAGFPSGEAYKVGSNTPYGTLPRAFFRQVIDLDGAQQVVEAGPNQFSGSKSANNVTLTIGKFSVVDIFDNNAYAHDARSDFLNWAILDAGAFDYAADSWGFTNGAAVEWSQDWWTLRGGVFQLSGEPNGRVNGFDVRQHAVIAEFEERHQFMNRPGKLKLLAFVNRGDMANYQDAILLAQQTGSTPDVSLVRSYTSRSGIAINFEQELTPDLGVFARLSGNDGSKEAYEFTEINRSIAGGISVQGRLWGRPNDRFAVGGAVNGLSSSARAYLSAGGLGIVIGDGRLNYDDEKIVEAYYSMALTERFKVTANYQRVINPAYNQDRGPVSIFALRFHVEY